MTVYSCLTTCICITIRPHHIPCSSNATIHGPEFALSPPAKKTTPMNAKETRHFINYVGSISSILRLVLASRPTSNNNMPRHTFTQERRPLADGKWPAVQIPDFHSGPLILFACPCSHQAGYGKKKSMEFNSTQPGEYNFIFFRRRW